MNKYQHKYCNFKQNNLNKLKNNIILQNLHEALSLILYNCLIYLLYYRIELKILFNIQYSFVRTDFEGLGTL